MRVSNTQRSLYIQCPQRYKYRYKHKMRERAKGSALPFGVAFDQASDVLFKERNLQAAIQRFSEIWMASEGNLEVKFSKTDLDIRVYQPSDIAKLEAAAGNLNVSEAKKRFDKGQIVEDESELDEDEMSKSKLVKVDPVITLIKDIKKMKEQSFMRDLTREEEQFLHYANILCMNRKGHLMLESFNSNILPHITEVISTQFKIDVENGSGDTITGYIDLVCRMTGYKLPNGRVLTDQDVVVADVKTAGITFWQKLDDLSSSDQLQTYVCSPQIQSLSPTNLVCYMAVAKSISKDETYACDKCGHIKVSSHKTCNNEVEGNRCGGDWVGNVKYFSEAKIVIGEVNLQEASKVYSDYDGVVQAIKHEIHYRNRESCNAYGQICPYKNICDRCLTPEQEEVEIKKWIRTHGE